MGVPAFTRGFRFPINWKERLSITYEAKTEILTSRNGTEQRIGWRETPRKRIEYQALPTGGIRQRLHATLMGGRDTRYIVGDPTRSTLLDADYTAGDPILVAQHLTTFDLEHWAKPGAQILVANDANDQRFAFATVVSANIGLGQIEIEAPLPTDWPAGSRIHHGIPCYLAESTRITEHTSAAWSFDLAFDGIPGELMAETVGEPAETYNTLEVLTFKPNWRDGFSDDIAIPREDLDNGFGVVDRFWPIEFAGRTHRSNFLFANSDEVEAFREFFYRMDGRRGQFYMATGTDDLTPVSRTSTQLVTQGSFAVVYFNSDAVHKDIEVLLKDGSKHRHHVDEIQITIDGAYSVFTVQPEMTWDLNEVKRISWLLNWRLASDSMTFDFATDSVAECEISFMTLPALPYPAEPDT